MSSAKSPVFISDNRQSKEKKTYTKPAILEEETYETYANLYCAKAVRPCHGGPGSS